MTASALWPRRPCDRVRVREQAQKPLNWEIFEEMVLLHRVGPMVFHNLREYAPDCVPTTVLQALEKDVAGEGLSVFRNLQEISRLMQIFSAASIPLRVLKGIPLAIVAYGDAGLRDTGDIDLLIDKRDIAAADSLLQKAGYFCIDPEVKMTPRRFAYYADHWKDFVYEHKLSGLSVELHWRLTRNRAMPGGALTRTEALSHVTAGSVEIPALAFDEMFFHLCLHGALDAWMRLKSLADIVALCRDMQPVKVEQLARRAAELDLLTEMSAAILLANRVFAVEIDCTGLLSATHPVVRQILDFSWNAISADGYLLPRENISGSRWVWYEMGLHRSFAYRWEILQRIPFRPRVWDRIPLPDSLFYLYPLLSPFEWLHFHVSRVLSRGTPGGGAA